MKAKNTIFLLFLSCLFYQCNTMQHGSDSNYLSKNSKFKDGECYAKCLIPDQLEKYSDEYPIYTGNELEEEVEIITKRIEVSPASTKWVKKKADKNCRSADPKDCLVWCLVEIPAEVVELKILADTTQSANYELQNIEQAHLIKKGGHTEWKAVLCEKDISKQVIGQIQSALRANGYYQAEDSFMIDQETKNSLKKFQEDNNLPIGNLDYETLDVLGVVI